jgi:hypothetical protein
LLVGKLILLAFAPSDEFTEKKEECERTENKEMPELRRAAELIVVKAG